MKLAQTQKKLSPPPPTGKSFIPPCNFSLSRRIMHTHYTTQHTMHHHLLTPHSIVQGTAEQHNTPHHFTSYLFTIRITRHNTPQRGHITHTSLTWARHLMSDHNTDRGHNTTHKNTPHRPTPQHTARQHHNLAHTTAFVPHTTYITPHHYTR